MNHSKLNARLFTWSSINRSTILLLGVFFCSITHAQKNLWELGGAAGAFDFRLYPGSSQSKSYLLPLPYFTFRSKYLEIDRGIRGILPAGSHWHLDLSADFGLPVDSSDSDVRAGMPNLDAVLQIGPSLEYSIIGEINSPRQFRLELPLRTAISIDKDNTANEGWLIEPRLVYELRRTGRTGLFAKVRAGIRYASQDYHAYYYNVDPQFVTPERDFFQSEKGYSGFVLDLRSAWREDDLIFWGLIRYQNLQGAEYENSPLVEDTSYYFIGLGVTWVFAGNY